MTFKVKLLSHVSITDKSVILSKKAVHRAKLCSLQGQSFFQSQSSPASNLSVGSLQKKSTPSVYCTLTSANLKLRDAGQHHTCTPAFTPYHTEHTDRDCTYELWLERVLKIIMFLGTGFHVITGLISFRHTVIHFGLCFNR